MKIEIVQAEAFVVGPEDRVIIKVPRDLDEDGVQSLLDHLVQMGLKDRALIVAGEFEITQFKPEE